MAADITSLIDGVPVRHTLFYAVVILTMIVADRYDLYDYIRMRSRETNERNWGGALLFSVLFLSSFVIFFWPSR
ncbi:hypothetical protein [Hansschlegelia zhihuaiae]|uniref:Uncharacterized protein n=1 Tax=Hansschlegelia zhihuaiae TaxID=405005 RepID=A0A4Q0M6V1_9HYPH|nr:hypothetical protein [Hansschlegelia zhihuaiae]RXF68724.1 hypothetical protein EK403_19340 [Hansschlegelia zhihuaiae]